MRSPLPAVIRSALFVAVGLLAGSSATSAQERGTTGGRPYTPTGKDKLLREWGGNAASEATVAGGVAWLARQQQKDGSWKFDGTSKDQVAASGMALLPFLAAGEGPTEAKKYKDTVRKGIDWLADKTATDGKLSNSMYSQAIGTTALCDAYALSRDAKLKAKAAAAVGYIVKAQAKNGSWGYRGAGEDGDTSIVGWQVQALTAARLAGIPFDKDKVFAAADKFLDSVSTDNGAKYGYRDKETSQTLTPVGLLCRNVMGTLPTAHPAFERGVEFLKQFPPRKEYFDMYYYYYATRVVHLHGGPDWHKFWNPRIRDLLIDLQDKGGDEARKGSWKKDEGFIGSACGRLGTTAMAVLTLEVYYRYPSLKKDGGLKVIDK